MSHNKGTCPVCEKEIRANDDAVVCPDCGTPYHRECYLKAGNCVHRDKHGTGYEYKPPQEHDTPGTAARMGYTQPGDSGVTMVSCQNCGTRNSARNIFCESCGVPLHGQPQPPQQQPYGQQKGPMGGFGPAAFVPPAQDLSGEIDGIDKRDWAVYIGSSSHSYIPRMAQQQRSGHRFGFLLSAFFFPECYFGYRKMWGWAALAAFAMALLYVPDFLYVAALNGISTGITASALDIINNIAFVAGLLIRMGSGIFSVYIYRKSGGKRIKKLREQYTDSTQYQEALRKKGGTSWLAVLAVVVLYMGLMLAVQYLFGIDYMGYLLSLYML